MNRYLDDYEKYLFSRGFSSVTVSSYIADIKKYSDFCEKHTIISDTEKTATSFIEYCREYGIKQSTINRRIASLKSYYDFLDRKGYIKKNPVKRIKSKKISSYNTNYLSRNEIVKILSIVPKSNKEYRDRMIIELLYATGIKVSELTELKITDFNRRIGSLNIEGKNKRTVIMYLDASNNLGFYLDSIRPLITKNNSDCIFTNMKGQKLTRQGINKIIDSFSDKTDIEKTITPNSLRNSFAKHMLENGETLRSVQQQLGHKNKSQTKVYI
ncbi:MAG: tyrosine-type recombinase/integrase [Clostridia bacterium]|nr:tyrosine-type recombinase/integrase [Clostridia bacterium]